MDLTVAIRTFNGALRLPATLEALRRQEGLPATEWELLLIDNNSTDQTCTLFEDFQKTNPNLHCRLIRESVPGQAAAARRAFGEATAPWICMVDDDNLLAPHYLKTGLDYIGGSAANIGAFGGRSVGKFEGSEPAYLKAFCPCLAIWDGGAVQRPLIREREHLAGLFLRTEAVRSVMTETWLTTGRSPTCPFGGEDSESILKITRRGWQVWYVPELAFQHVIPGHRTKLRSLLRLRVLQGGEVVFLALGYSDPQKSLTGIAMRQYFIEGWAKFLARILLFCFTPGERRWYHLDQLAMRWGTIRYFFTGLAKFGLRRGEVSPDLS